MGDSGNTAPLPLGPPPASPRRSSPPELELEDDAIRDILLRFPPTPLPLGSSKDLVHASLVCKRWRRILLDPAFLRYYRELHHPPPLLGFLRYRRGWDDNDFFFHERFAVVEGDGLYLWSHPAGHKRPSLLRVVDLKAMLPVGAPSFSPVKFGLAKDGQIICLATDAGTFTVELGSGRVTDTGSSISFVPPYLNHVNEDFLESSALATVRGNNPADKEEEQACCGAKGLVHGNGSSSCSRAMPRMLIFEEGANLSNKCARDENWRQVE